MGDISRIKAALREEFPGWSILHTDRHRWWATRGPKPGEQVNNGESALDADTPEELRRLLLRVNDT
ncbi:hypothetical protein [Actinomadura miaoliensis]|uniref:Uncharacterized protein n=1 Tax=Actinomadura miaoliensis TaxID=430685 RepID=A0ABP7W5V2_9ACTN